MAFVPTLPERWSPATPVIPPEEERGDIGLSFEIGKRQLATTPAWFQGVGASIFEKAGFESAARDWRDRANNTILEMSLDIADLEAQYDGPRTFKEAQDLGKPGAYALWGINTIANQAPILATQVLGALGGALIGAGVGVVTGGPAGIAAGVGVGARAGWMASRPVRWGATFGTLATSALLNTGEIYSSVLLETGENRPGVTGFAGLIAGSLDAINPGRFLVGKGMGRSFGVWFGRKLGVDNMAAKGFLTAMEYAAVEGITERLQNHIEIMTVNYIKENNLFAEYTEWQREELTESTAAGGLLGAVLGWIPGVTSGRITTRPSELAEAITDPLEEVETPTAPTTPPRRPGFGPTEGPTVTELAAGLWPETRIAADPEGYTRFKKEYADALSTEAADALAGTRTATEPKPRTRRRPTFGVTELEGGERPATRAAPTVTPTGEVPGEARRSQSKQQLQADFNYLTLRQKYLALEGRQRAGEDVADELNETTRKLDVAARESAQLDRDERGGEGLDLEGRTLSEIEDSIDAYRREPVEPTPPPTLPVAMRKPEEYAIIREFNRRIAELKKKYQAARDKWSDMEDATIEDYMRVVNPAELEYNLAIMNEAEYSSSTVGRTPEGQTEYENARTKVARILDESPALATREREIQGEFAGLRTGVTPPTTTVRKIRKKKKVPGEKVEAERVKAPLTTGVRELAKKEEVVVKEAAVEEERVSTNKEKLAKAMATVDAGNWYEQLEAKRRGETVKNIGITRTELWQVVKGSGVTFKDLGIKALPSKGELFTLIRDYVGKDLWDEHVMVEGVPRYVREVGKIRKKKVVLGKPKEPSAAAKKRSKAAAAKMIQDWKDKTLYREYLTAVLEDAEKKLSTEQADARIIRASYETADGQWISFAELNKDYLGYIASQVSPPIPVETTRYFVEEEASADVKARQERQRREGKKVDRVGYWRTGPKFPLKMKSVYDELKRRAEKYVITDEELKNIRDNIISTEVLVDVTRRVLGRLETRKLEGETLGLPGELKVTLGQFDLPVEVARGEVETDEEILAQRVESLTITDTSEYEDYTATIDEDQMWHGDVESNYLLETTPQEGVDEFIDNKLKRELQLFLQAPYVDPAHPTKKTSTGRIKVWVIPKAEFFKRFPSDKEQLSAIGAKIGRGVDMYDKPRLTFIDEETTKKYTKELLPQYSKLREEPAWVKEIKKEAGERTKKTPLYVSRSGNFVARDPTTKLLVAYKKMTRPDGGIEYVEFAQQHHAEQVKAAVRDRLDFLLAKFGKKSNIPMWALQLVANEFNIKTRLNVEAKLTPKGKTETLRLDNLTMDEMISSLEIPDPRAFRPAETPEGREGLEEAYIGGASFIPTTEEEAAGGPLPGKDFFLSRSNERQTGVSTSYQRAAAEVGSVVDLTIRKGDAPLEHVRGKIINWIPAQYVPENEMSYAEIKAANENGLQEVEILDKARLPELKEGQRSAAIEEGKAFRAEIGTRDPTLIQMGKGERQKGTFVYRTYYKTSPEMIEVLTEDNKKHRFDKDNIVYMSTRTANIFNPEVDRVTPTSTAIYENIRKNSIKFNESPGDFLARISEPKYREGDVYIPGTAVGAEEIFVGAKVYKVIDGETHYNKIYTVREVSDTGRVRLESEQGFNRRLLPDVDVVIPEDEFTKTGKLRKRTIKRKGEVEAADYGWFTRGEIAIFNPSQVEIARQRPARAEIFTGPSRREKGEWLEEKFGNQRPLQKTVSIKDVGLGNAVKLQIRAFKRSLVRGVPKWSVRGDVFVLVPDYTFADQKVNPKTYRISDIGKRYITLHDVALGEDVLKVSVRLLAATSINSQASIDAVTAEIEERLKSTVVGEALRRGEANVQEQLDESPWMFVEEEKFEVTDADRRVPKGELVGGGRRAGQFQSAPTARWANEYGVVINEIYIDRPGEVYTSDGEEVSRIPVYQVYNPWGIEQLEMHDEFETVAEAMKKYSNKKFYDGMSPSEWRAFQVNKRYELSGRKRKETIRISPTARPEVYEMEVDIGRTTAAQLKEKYRKGLTELTAIGSTIAKDTHADLPFDEMQKALQDNVRMFGPLKAELAAWSKLMEAYPNLGKRNKYGEVFIPVALRRKMAEHGVKDLRELFDDLKKTAIKEYEDALKVAYASVKKEDVYFSIDSDSIVSEDNSIVILAQDQKPGITPKEVIDILVAAYGEGIRNIVHVVQYQQELPVKYHRSARIRGVTNDKEMWLVSDGLPREYVIPVVTHEIGGHGLQAIVGKKAYGQILDFVGRLSETEPAMKHAMDEAEKALKKTTPDASEALVLEETFAYFVQHNSPENTSFWRTLIDYIVAGLARLKLAIRPSLLTPTDLIALARTAVRQHARRAKNSKDSVFVSNWLGQPLYMASPTDWAREEAIDPVIEATTGHMFTPDWLLEDLPQPTGLGHILEVERFPATKEVRKGSRLTFRARKGRVGFGVGQTLERWIIDVNAPIHRLVNALKKRGVDIPVEADPSHRASRLRMKTVHEIKKFEQTYVDPLWNFLKKVGIKHAQISDFHWYLYLTHAPYRNALYFKRNPKKGKYQSGLADEPVLNPDGTRNAEIPVISEKWQELRDSMQAREDRGGPTVAEQMKNFEEAAQYVYAINKARLRLLLDWGLVDQKTIDKWTADKGFSDTYVPLRGEGIGFVDELFGEQLSVAELNVRGPESKKAVGRRSPAENVIGWSVLQFQQSIKRAQKNQVVATMARMVHENQFVINPTTGKQERAFVDEMIVVSRKDFKEGREGIDPETGEPFLGLYPKYFLDPDHVSTFKENGEEWMILMKDPRIGQALNRSHFDTAGRGVRFLAATMRIMGAMRTAWDVAFIPTNFSRDLGTGIFNIVGYKETSKGTREDLSDLKLGDIVKDIPKAMKGLYQNIRGETEAERTGTPWAMEAEIASSVGGRIDFAGWKNIMDFDKTMQRTLNDGTKDGFKRYADAMATYVSDINSVVENATRLAAFKHIRAQYIKNGMPEAEANERAGRVYRELTVDFSKRGEKSMAWNSLYLFFRAGVLGSARVISTIGRSRKVRNLMKGVFLFGFAQSMLNYFAAGDDDDGRNRWLQIKLNQKSRYMYMYVPGLDYFQKIPLPYGFGVFYVYGDAFATMLLGGATFPQVAGHMFSATMESYMPISLGNSDSFIKSTLKTATPTLATPLLELGLNENWMGNPIYREPYPNGRVDPPSERYWNSTGPTAKWISRWANDLTGGTEFKEGMVSVEPDILEHLWEFATGGLGRFVRGTLDTGVATVGPGKMTHWETGDINWRKVPVLYRYFHDETITRRWDIRTKDMEYGRAIDTATSIRDAIRTKYGTNSEEYKGYTTSEDFELAKLQKLWRSKESRETKLYKRIAAVERSKMLSNKAKEERVNELRELIRLGRVRFIKTFEQRI
jgi:hypothetical protein